MIKDIEWRTMSVERMEQHLLEVHSIRLVDDPES
jgi:hypothetical protein